MTTIVRIDDEVIDTEDFVRILKLTGRFEGLMEEIVRERLTVHAAKKQGLPVTPAEIQERADQFRRVLGLHRAADMNNYLDGMHVTLDEFEAFIVDGLYHEMMLLLADDPESFAELAREHSIADTREQGGFIGKVLRGSLKTDIEAKVFNASAGALLGPFPAADRSFFEIFLVNAKNPARLDEDTSAEVRRLLREEWLAARAQDHVIEAR